jgi:WD40 repeat protein
MSELSIHRRHGAAPQDEEGPLPSSESSSLGQASSPSIPKIPLDLMADLILPFVADRVAWNSVCCASKELYLVGKKMTPPWPNKAFNDLGDTVRKVVFSPSGLHLAFAIYRVHDGAYEKLINVWDRWGKQTHLAGHTRYINCLEYSLDGEHLASGSRDGSIRIWHSESFHATSSKTSMETSTRTPQFADTIFSGSLSDSVLSLSFSRTDSNLLASGCTAGVFRVWNVKEEACIHSFDPGDGRIRSLYFAGGAGSTCIAVANTGSIIRLWRAEGSSHFACEVIGEAVSFRNNDLPLATFSSSGSFLATSKNSFRANASTLALYELETMTKTQYVVMPGFSTTCFAVSSDSKQLVIGDRIGRIRLLQADDFSLQTDLDTRGEESSNVAVLSAAFDPTCRVLAFCCDNGRLELRTL